MAKKNLHSYKTQISLDAVALLAASLKHSENLRLARAMEALRGGVLAHFVKENVVTHGDFQKWIAKSDSLSHFSFRTIQRKMRLADAFRKDVALSADDLAKSDFVRGKSTEDKLGKQAQAWIGERSMYQLYQDYGIVKAEAAGGQHNSSTETPEARQQREFMEFCQSFKQLTGTIATHVTTGTIHKLPTALRVEMCETSAAALEAIVANTADLTPAQLEALKERLISINGTIRERLSIKVA